MAYTTHHVTTQDNIRISYDRYRKNHDRVVILAHGFFNSKQAVLFQKMARALNDAFDVVVMDFRGHGRSEGRFTWTAKETLDLEAVIADIRPHYARLGLVGFSLGAAISINAAARTNGIDSLIAVSAPVRFRRVDGHFWSMDVRENIIYNVFQEGRIGKGVRPHHLWFKKTCPLDSVRGIHIPVLFLYGKKDWLIRPWHGPKLYAACASERKRLVMVEGTHAEYLFRSFPDEMTRIFKEWFEETL